jgi:hypothetical protein
MAVSCETAVFIRGVTQIKGVHMRAYTERRCPICKVIVSVLVHDYGVVTFENFDEKVGVNNIPVKPTRRRSNFGGRPINI